MLKNLLASVCVLGVITAGSARAQEDEALTQLYGAAVHSYFAGNYEAAHADLTVAIDGGLQDPRCYYFRAMAYRHLGRPEEAEADMAKGAELEAKDVARRYPVGRSLARIQGPSRLMLEKHRVRARLAQYTQERQRDEKRYEETQQRQEGVLRNQVEIALEDLAGSEESGDKVPEPAKITEPRKAPEPSKVAQPSADAEPIEPQQKVKPHVLGRVLGRVGAKALAGETPAGGGDAQAPGKATDDPFGIGAPDTNESPDPFGEPDASEDPFGGSDQEEKQKDKASGEVDPFGGSDEAPSNEDPFGGAAEEPADDSQPAEATDETEDPFAPGDNGEAGEDNEPAAGEKDSSAGDDASGDPFGDDEEGDGDDPFGAP